MSKLSNKEIDYIINTYKKEKSIYKTSQITGFSKNTVNNYVRNISKNDIRSRNCKNPIIQIDKRTNEIIKEYPKPALAAKKNNIDPACICRCLKGELKTAGGFIWKYKNKKNKSEIISSNT